jgi:hypothetical protein
MVEQPQDQSHKAFDQTPTNKIGIAEDALRAQHRSSEEPARLAQLQEGKHCHAIFSGDECGGRKCEVGATEPKQ